MACKIYERKVYNLDSARIFEGGRKAAGVSCNKMSVDGRPNDGRKYVIICCEKKQGTIRED